MQQKKGFCHISILNAIILALKTLDNIEIAALQLLYCFCVPEVRTCIFITVFEIRTFIYRNNDCKPVRLS